MTSALPDSLQSTEFDALIESYAARSEPDALSFAAFDQMAQRLAQEAVAETIELTGVVEKGAFVFDSPQAAPVIAHGNEVIIGGLRLVVKLRPDRAVA